IADNLIKPMFDLVAPDGLNDMVINYPYAFLQEDIHGNRYVFSVKSRFDTEVDGIPKDAEELVKLTFQLVGLSEEDLFTEMNPAQLQLLNKNASASEEAMYKASNKANPFADYGGILGMLSSILEV
ncbi:MAG: hypothetical protein ACRCXZ_01705, partial [Patescibacteria group bacterium]